MSPENPRATNVAPSTSAIVDQIDRLLAVDGAALCLRALVGSRRELTLGQSVHAVVLDDVDHVDAAAHDVRELAEPDRRGVAVAGNAEIDQIAIGERGAGQHGRHAAVHAVEAVRLAEEIGRRFRRAADPRQLRDPVRRDANLEEAWMIAAEIESWPQPAHNVDTAPS